jgi:hypothetical protein
MRIVNDNGNVNVFLGEIREGPLRNGESQVKYEPGQLVAGLKYKINRLVVSCRQHVTSSVVKGLSLIL